MSSNGRLKNFMHRMNQPMGRIGNSVSVLFAVAAMAGIVWHTVQAEAAEEALQISLAQAPEIDARTPEGNATLGANRCVEAYVGGAGYGVYTGRRPKLNFAPVEINGQMHRIDCGAYHKPQNPVC